MFAIYNGKRLILLILFAIVVAVVCGLSTWFFVTHMA